MLNLFNSFVVPGVDHVTMFQDDQDDHLYYMVPELPEVVKNSDGSPMFSLIAFARDFSLMKEAAAGLPGNETEGGLMNVTLELSVSEEKQNKIREHIQRQQAPQLLFRPHFLAANRIAMAPVRLTRPINLSYPHWVDGTVSFDLIPGDAPTFVKGKVGSEKPSLVRNNLASYEVLLGQEGVRLLRSSLKKNWCPGNVRYSVSFVARIPSLTIRIHGRAEDVYKEIKTHCTVTEYYNGNGKVRMYQYPAVDSLKEMREMFASLTIDVDVGEFRPDAAGSQLAQEAQKKLQDLALTIAQDYLKNRFCTPGFGPGLNPEKLGTDPFAHDPNRPAGVAPLPANQLWLKDFSQTSTGELDFTVTSRTNLTVSKHPNSALYAMVTPAEIEGQIIEADLNQPIFNILDVPVVVNADFERDPIAAVKVFVDYQQRDDITGEQKSASREFLFDTANEKFRFQTVLARSRDGVPKDNYNYRSQIIYKSSIPSEMTPASETRERNLVVTYERLSCVNVVAQWGAAPADTVARIQVHFRYPGLNSSTAEKDVSLTPDKPMSTWFTYTGGNTSRQYEYQITYFLLDGQKITEPVKSGISDVLVVNAPFEDTLEVTFVPQGAFPPMAQIAVTARYLDPANQLDVSKVFVFKELGKTAEWSVRLIDRAKRDFQYKVDVMFVDGSTNQGEFRTGAEGTVLVGDIAREMLNVQVITELLDMANTWRLVVVRLNYSDPANQLASEEIFKITAANANQEFVWKIPLKDASRRRYTQQIQAFARDPAKNKVIGPIETEDPVIILEF